MTSSKLIGILLGVCLGSHMAAGDVVVTKTGSRYEGKVEQEGDFYVLTKPGGGKIRLPRSTIKEFIKAPPPGTGGKQDRPKQPRTGDPTTPIRIRSWYSYLVLKTGTGIPTCEVALKYEKVNYKAGKVKIVAELTVLADKKRRMYTTTSEGDVSAPKGVVDASAMVTGSKWLSGKGLLKVYLKDAGGRTVVSNVLSIPIAADRKAEAELKARFAPAKTVPPPDGGQLARPGEIKIIPSGWRPLKDLEARQAKPLASDKLDRPVQHTREALSVEAYADVRSILTAYVKLLARLDPPKTSFRATPGAIFEVVAAGRLYRARVGPMLVATVEKDKTVTLDRAYIDMLNTWDLPDGTRLPAGSNVHLMKFNLSQVSRAVAPGRERPRPTRYARPEDLPAKAFEEVHAMMMAYLCSMTSDGMAKHSINVPRGQTFTVALGRKVCKVEVSSGMSVSVSKDGQPSERSWRGLGRGWVEVVALNDWTLSDGTRVPARSKLRIMPGVRQGDIARPLGPGQGRGTARR